MTILAIQVLNLNHSYMTATESGLIDDSDLTISKIYPIIGEGYKFVNDRGYNNWFVFPHPNLIGLTFVDLWEQKRRRKV